MPNAQRIRVPMGRGIGNDVDTRVREPQFLKRATNVHMPNVSGRLEKRNGFTARTRLQAANNQYTGLNIDAEGPVRALGHTTRELLCVGHRTLFAFSESTSSTGNRWLARGRVSPCRGETRERFRSSAEFLAGDVSIGNQYALYACEARTTGTGTGVLNQDWIEVEARKLASGEVVMRARLLVVTNSAATRPRAPRCFFLSGAGVSGVHYIVFCRDAAAPADLLVYRWDENAPLVSPGDVFGGTVTTTLYTEAGRPARTYDACPMGASAWALAWINNTTQDIEIRKFDASNVQTATATIVAGDDENYIRVGLDGDASNLYMITVQDFVITGLDQVEAWARTSTLTANWGPTLLQTLGGGGEFADNVSIRQVDNSAGNPHLCCSWLHATGIMNAGASNFWRTNNTTVNLSGTIAEAMVTVPNYGPIGRPFEHRNRVYQHLAYNAGLSVSVASPVASTSVGFCHNVLVEWNTGDLEEFIFARTPNKLAAMWDVGLAVPANELLRNGNCAQWSVSLDADGLATIWTGMFPTLSVAVPGEPTADIRCAWDEVRLEMDVAPLVTACLPDCAVIGGGYVCWYDGVLTSELHMPTAIVDHVTEVNGTGTLADGTYTYSMVLERQDHAGVLHRSPAATDRANTIAGGTPQHILVGAPTYTLSHHPHDEVGWQFFRATAADPVLRHVNRTRSRGANTDSAGAGDRSEDLQDGLSAQANDAPSVAIYTNGGIAPCVTPEGAQIPLVCRDSLWLGRFFRAARVQFSPPITPSAAGETAIAPRMMELFGRLIMSGEAVLGIGYLDDATVILTRRGVYIVAGEVPDPTGAGNSLSRAVELPADAGSIEPRSVASYPGGVLFRSERCFYRFSREHGLDAIGERIKSIADLYPKTTSAVVVPTQQQVRFTVTNAAGSSGRILVYDYRNDAWFEWLVRQAGSAEAVFVGATFFNGTYNAVRSDGEVFFEDPATFFDDTTEYVQTDVWLGNVQPSGPGSWQTFQRVDILGFVKDTMTLTMSLYADYEEGSPAEFVNWTATEIAALPAAGTRLELAHEPQIVTQAQALSVQLTETDGGFGGTGAGYALVALGFDVRPHGGPQRTTAEARV